MASSAGARFLGLFKGNLANHHHQLPSLGKMVKTLPISRLPRDQGPAMKGNVGAYISIGYIRMMEKKKETTGIIGII